MTEDNKPVRRFFKEVSASVFDENDHMDDIILPQVTILGRLSPSTVIS